MQGKDNYNIGTGSFNIFDEHDEHNEHMKYDARYANPFNNSFEKLDLTPLVNSLEELTLTSHSADYFSDNTNNSLNENSYNISSEAFRSIEIRKNMETENCHEISSNLNILGEDAEYSNLLYNNPFNNSLEEMKLTFSSDDYLQGNTNNSIKERRPLIDSNKNSDAPKKAQLFSNEDQKKAESDITKPLVPKANEDHQVFINLPKNLAFKLFKIKQTILITSANLLATKLINSWTKMPGNQDLNEENFTEIKHSLIEVINSKKINGPVLKKIHKHKQLHFNDEPIFNEMISGQLVNNSLHLAKIVIIPIDETFFRVMGTKPRKFSNNLWQFVMDVMKKTYTNNDFIDRSPEEISKEMIDNQDLFKYKNNVVIKTVTLSKSSITDKENIFFQLSDSQNEKLFNNSEGAKFTSINLLADRYARRLLNESKNLENVGASKFRRYITDAGKLLKKLFVNIQTLNKKNMQLKLNEEVIFDKKMTLQLCVGKVKTRTVVLVKKKSFSFDKLSCKNSPFAPFIREDFDDLKKIRKPQGASNQNTDVQSFTNDNSHSFFSNKNSTQKGKRPHESELLEDSEHHIKRSKGNRD